MTPLGGVFAASPQIDISQEVTVPPPEGESSIIPPDATPPKIRNLSVEKITLNSAKISWETKEQTLCSLFWGQTKDYEGGTIVEGAFYRNHSTELTDLLSGTLYHFKVSCKDTAQNQAETEDQKFTTLTPPDIIPPANVGDFEAIPGDQKITLKWKNPPDKDFKETRIFRSTDFYPTIPWEGKLVYVGQNTKFKDRGLTNGITYYYTAFSYDKAGNYSSGAVASAAPFKISPPISKEEIPTKEECKKEGLYWYDGACHKEPKMVPPPEVPPPEIPPPEVPPPEVKELSLSDFDFFQKEKKLSLKQGKIEVKEKEPLTISVDYSKVPEVLKTMIITLEKDKKYFSFLLRINPDKTKYLATIIPPSPGSYPLTLQVLNFKNQTLKTLKGQLKVEEKPSALAPKPSFEDTLKRWLWLGLGVGLAVVFCILFWWFKRRKKYR